MPRNDNKNILIILIILVSKTIFRNDIKMSILVLQSIHQSVVNLPVNIAEEEDEELRTMLAQLEYGNKISILG